MKEIQKTAVMYGAGNIGRGFIGQVFHDSGYEVIFVDIDRDVVTSINERKSYTQLTIDGDNIKKRKITGVRAVDGSDREAVIKEVATCDVMAVSVGAAVLPRIAPLLADGIKSRTKTLNILVCENLAHAPEVLKSYIREHLSDASVLERVGFIGASIGRMVPVIPAQLRENDPTLIAVEQFCTLPVDGDAVIQPMPELKHTVLCSPFAFEEGKKLYIHNMGHALAAYFGFLESYTFIWEAIEDKNIYAKVHNAMTATSQALAQKYSESTNALAVYTDDLLKRFKNKGLGDTITRVGGDPLRKLAPGDRLMGAVELCKEQDKDYTSILSGIAAALLFDVPGDPSSALLKEKINVLGIKTFLVDVCGLSEADAEKCV